MRAAAGQVIEVFVPGKLTNPLNGSLSRAHWSARSEWSARWKDATWNATAKLWMGPSPAPCWAPELPKIIAFLAQTGATWDDDSIPAAVKPCRDALMGWPQRAPTHWRLIHSDAPDSGHSFSYAQVVNRKARGVKITITPKEG